jgi:leucyl-tRNA synthetase
LIEDTINLPIQINGKLRDTLKIEINAKQSDAVKLALSIPKINQLINEKMIKKIIYVPNRILNFISK